MIDAQLAQLALDSAECELKWRQKALKMREDFNANSSQGYGFPEIEMDGLKKAVELQEIEVKRCQLLLRKAKGEQ